MIGKEIKSKEQAAKVARQMARDIKETLAVFGGYKTKVELYNSMYYVTVTSPEGYCNILTGSCIDYLNEVKVMYTVQYKGINYHLGVQNVGEKHIPAFVFCIGYQEEKKEQ